MTKLITSGEVWKQAYLPNYEVSNYGRVRNIKRNYILTNQVGSHGYKTVGCGNGVTKTIHRLMAIAFLPNPNNLEQVNHIDGVKTNNLLSNLEWVSRADNARHSFKLGLSYQSKAIKVAAIKDGKYTQYNSVLDASKATGIDRGVIMRAINGVKLRKDLGGYTFTL